MKRRRRKKNESRTRRRLRKGDVWWQGIHNRWTVEAQAEQAWELFGYSSKAE